MIYAAVGLISLASLAYEVLLPRLFSFTQWHHLSFLVISVVVFGFGAGGALASLAEARRGGLAVRVLDPERGERLAGLALLFGVSAAGSLVFLLHAPLDYFRLPVEPLQAVYLALTYLLLLMPFLFAGLMQALAFAALPGRSGRLYGAGMIGSACGAVLPLLLLPRLGEVRLALACAGLPLLPWIFRPLSPGSRGPARWTAAAACLSALALLAAMAAASGRVLQLKPSAYKLLAQAMQLPGTRALRTENELRGRVDWLDSPALRFTPGMSLAFPGGLPERELAVVDGDGLFLFYPLDSSEALEFARYTSSYAAYALAAAARARPEEVLILLESGGLSLACAARSGARSITVLARLPALARFLQRRYGDVLKAACGNARLYLARTERRYDLIQVESWGPSVPGMAGLAQDPLLTREAFAEYLAHLNPGGLLSLTRRVHLPPSDSLRLFGNAYAALARSGAPDPAAHIAMLRSWDTYTLVVSRRPFSESQLHRFREFCRERSFDLLFLKTMEEAEANRYNLYERPFHYLELQRLHQALERGRPWHYYRAYLLDVRPATDEKPFPNRFTRWLRIGALYRATGSRLYSLLLSGEVVLLATLALALALGLPLLILPRCLSGGGSLAIGPANALYFLAGGAGFMLAELGLIQDFTNLLAEPVLAVALVLAGLLVASGAGAVASSGWKRAGMRRTAAALAAGLLILAGARPLLFSALARLPGSWRAAGALLLLAAVGFPLGVPLPMGLSLLTREAGQRAYAWTLNGIFSVLASLLALPLAMQAGIRAVYLAAAGCYALALLMLMRVCSAAEPGFRASAAQSARWKARARR